MIKCPCRGCERRTLTCRQVCKPWQEWKEEQKAVKEWLDSFKPVHSESALRHMNRQIKSKARGWTGKKGSDWDV